MSAAPKGSDAQERVGIHVRATIRNETSSGRLGYRQPGLRRHSAEAAMEPRAIVDLLPLGSPVGPQ